MKQIRSIFVAFFILISVMGLGSAAVTITGLANVSTSDQTPTVTFTVTGTNASYVTDLYIDGVASGVVTAINATLASITCNQTLASGSVADYYVSAYNATEVPARTNSTTYTMTVGSFAGLTTMLGDLVSVFAPIIDLVIAVGTIMVALAMIGFIMTIIGIVLKTVSGGLKKG